MLNQMAFWLHCYPELYFMKAKKVTITLNLLIEPLIQHLGRHSIKAASLYFFVVTYCWNICWQVKVVFLNYALKACMQVAAANAYSLNASLFGGVVIPLVKDIPLSPKEGNSFHGVCLFLAVETLYIYIFFLGSLAGMYYLLYAD